MSEQAPVESSAPEESNVEEVESQDQSSEESGESGEIEALEQAVEDGQISAAEANKMIRKFKLKVDGQEMETEIDLNDMEAVKNELQLSAAAKRRMQETANIKKQYLKEMERLKSDPFSVLAEMGLDPEELSAGFIQKKIEEMKKSPEQLAAERMQSEMQELRAKLKAQEEKEQQAEMSKLNEQAVSSLNQEIDKAISGHTKLPNSPLVRKKIADSMLWAINNGFGDVTADDVVPLVEKELRSELGSLFEGLEDEAFEDWVGKERLTKARKKRVAAKSVPTLADIKPTSAGARAKQEVVSSPKIKAKDFFRKR
jgi:hypothetical protein